MSLLKLLGWGTEKGEEAGASASEAVGKITEALQEMEPQRARYLAAFAYLLGRAAHADRNVSPSESRMMEAILQQKGGLTPEQARLAVEITRAQNQLFGHIENFLVSREFRDLASREQKLRLLDCLFAVSCSDKKISVEEDREIRQIASEVGLEHPDFIQVRSRYREHLAFLKRPKTSP